MRGFFCARARFRGVLFWTAVPCHRFGWSPAFPSFLGWLSESCDEKDKHYCRTVAFGSNARLVSTTHKSDTQRYISIESDVYGDGKTKTNEKDRHYCRTVAFGSNAGLVSTTGVLVDG